MKIEILGTGCAKCRQTFEAVAGYVKEKNLPHEVVKVEAMEKIIAYGVMTTPAIVVDGRVVLKGKVPGKGDLDKLLG
jgi:small redox-active disulfide protein 2